MKPSQLAAQLRRIAAAIEASKKPSRALVSRDLRRVLANMDKTWVLMSRPDGWTGFEAPGGASEFEALVRAADTSGTVPEFRIEILPGGPDASHPAGEGNDAGFWHQVDAGWLKKALADYAAGDYEALVP